MRYLSLVAATCLLNCTLSAQTPLPANTDELQVKPYTLPDPMLMPNGQLTTTAKAWNELQRPYIYKLFEDNVFGRYPHVPIKIHYRVQETSSPALDGRAIRRQVRIFLSPTDSAVYIDLLMYLPADARKPVPVFLGLNFMGNQATQPDPGIYRSQRWTAAKYKGVVNNKATDSTRGIDPGWPMEDIIKRGYGVATAYYGDLEADHVDGWKTGIRSTLRQTLKTEPAEWGAIGAWAWGLSRIMDYLIQDKQVDGKNVFVIGHSRLGKAALWAGASDKRFKVIISNESGEGGAALSKRLFGETVKDLNTKFPYWFSPAYTRYNGNRDSMPFDAHMLLALAAPRPLYVASAAGDLWSDPKGEFLGAYHAGKVYALFGKQGLDTDSMPPPETPVGHTIRYHIRRGKHDITRYDWQEYMNFTDTFR